MDFLVGIEAKIVLVLPFVAFLADIFKFGHAHVPTNCRAFVQIITVEELMFGVKVILGERLPICLEIRDGNWLSGNSVKCVFGSGRWILVKRTDGLKLHAGRRCSRFGFGFGA